jgi:RNA-directed DNA polymerase
MCGYHFEIQLIADTDLFNVRKGTPRVKRRTARKKLRDAVQRLKDSIKGLNRRLVGHYNYYGLRGNSRDLWRFFQTATE